MGDSSHDDTLDTIRTALAGRYAFERVLGEGAMGRVVLARDVTLDRLVAIKVISPELGAASMFRERFLLEARTVAKLRHANIVTVHEAGEAAGHLYFVMEYVAGRSLRELIDHEKKSPPERAAPILADVAEALGYAHGQGIVHRDVKPENILLDGLSGRAMLTDFGIARALSAAGDGRLTGTGLLVGSPRYMSPEQAAGERELDGRTDIYSLGLVGYELLTGESPFPGASGASLIARQITQAAPPLKSRAPNAPPSLATAIDRALEKDPDHRWQNASDMANALRGTALIAASPRRSTVRRWWPALIAGAAAIAAAVTWGLISPKRSSADDERRPLLVIPFGVLRGDASLDWLRQGSVDMLTRNLAQWRDVPVVDYEHTLDLIREAGLDGASTIGLTESRALARQAKAGTVLLGQLQRNGDSITVVARLYDVDDGSLVKEIPVSGRADADTRWLFDELASEMLGLSGSAPSGRKVQVARITTTSVEAYRHYLNGARALHAWNLEAADSAFDRATTIDSTFALAYYKRAQTQGWRRSSDTLARHYARLAAAHAERLPARERALVQGNLDFLEGNYTRAQQRFESLLAQDSTDAEAWYGLGDAIHHAPSHGLEEIAPRFTAALRAFNRAIAFDSSFHLAYSHQIEIYRRGGDPGFSWIIENDTLRYFASEDDARRFGRDRIERARARARELAITSALHWVDADPSAGPAYHALGDAYAAARRYDEAIATLERAMRQPASRHPDFAYRMASYQLGKQPNEALVALRQAMQTYPADSLAQRGTASRMGMLVTAGNVAAATGALADLDRLFATVNRVDPVLPGSQRSGHPEPTSSYTGPLRITTRAILGLATTADRRFLDSAIARNQSLPEPAGSATRKREWGLAYASYVISHDPKYLEIIRRWSGKEPPLVLQALAALRKGDTAKAAQLAERFPPPDTARLVSAPNEIEDPLNQALVLSAVGQPRAAIAILEAIEPSRLHVLEADPRWAVYARSQFELGLLYEQTGNRTQALAAYQRYLDLMRDADAALEPQRQAARARVQALRDAPGTSLPRQ